MKKIYYQGKLIPSIRECIELGHPIIAIHLNHHSCTYALEARDYDHPMGKAECSIPDVSICPQCNPDKVF